MRIYGTFPPPRPMTEEERVQARIAATLRRSEERKSDRLALLCITVFIVLWAIVSTLDFATITGGN